MSFFEETNPADITSNEIIGEVKKYLPECTRDTLTFFYHGTYNVFRTTDEYIVRVPDKELRNEEGIELLTNEKRILDFLAERLTIAIPKILYINKNPKKPFSIHKMIPGKSLSYFINDLISSQRKQISKRIGQLLSELHSQKLKEEYIELFSDIQYSSDQQFKMEYQEFWRKNYSDAKRYAFKFLNKDQRTWLIRVFENFLKNNENFNFSPRLAHCDFDSSNILYNQTTQQISGIIDFEECKIFDPAVDLLFYREGNDFLSNLLQNYEFKEDESLQQRMEFYFSRTCAPYIVWGVKYNRPRMIEVGLEKIENNMKLFSS